jgi:nucleotide-binding universal stress UspA family protein
MPTLDKILIPIDFSPATEGAIDYGKRIAAQFGARLTLLHVVRPLQFEFAMAQPTPGRYADLVQSRTEAVREALERFAERQWDGVHVQTEIREGDAAEEIVARAHEDGFGLIVMPTRGSGPLRRWLFIGSVTAKVLAGAECPVLTGLSFPEAGEEIMVRRVVCAVDLGATSEGVLHWAWNVAQRYDAALTVVHAAAAAGEANQDYFDESWRSTLITRLRQRICEITREAGIEAEILVEAGNAPAVVAGAANRMRADLVVIGRSTANGLLGRLRANAYDIIRRSPCPVISV